ncbi:hypothetical protein JR316_0002747 [Psilocybe cubensis]|uniref:Uncharacterized protein n=2 Tax=Psilocybe cubensis TaxID=181762 RepID=A0ACB8HDY7_PSICU|nr:hypothetical protein JR316_0002747 [Psilocybe cubensis]KAH9485832.1 hypothetical protein JR316_0002747 [Psilocybe cubensis]
MQDSRPVFPYDPSPVDYAENILVSTYAYKACARIPLPARLKTFIWNRVDDIVSYSTEIFCVIILIHALFSGYSGAGVRSKSIKADFWKIVSHPDFPETAEELFPRFFGWYTFFLPVQRRTSLELQRVAFEAGKAKNNFRALFTRSPVEAVMIYQAEMLSGRRGHHPKPPSGYVRLHFYTNFEKGESPDKLNFPDATLDLPVEHKGVDLALARKAWGIESIAVITNAESFKKVFYPADDDWLSPLAVYDLSRQFKQPIRVFEPRVHKFTKTERTIRRPIYHLTYFMFSLVKLLLGFPERNIAYLSVAYGPKYAAFYKRIGALTPPIKDWFATGGFLALQLLIVLCVLPFAIAYSICLSAGKAVQWISLLIWGTFLAAAQFIHRQSIAAAKFIITSLLKTLQFASSTVIDFATYITTLRRQDWIITISLTWLVLAEYYHSPS